MYGRMIGDHLQPTFACKVWRAQYSSFSYGQWAASAAGASGIISFYTCWFPYLSPTSETYLSWNSNSPCKLSYLRSPMPWRSCIIQELDYHRIGKTVHTHRRHIKYWNQIFSFILSAIHFWLQISCIVQWQHLGWSAGSFDVLYSQISISSCSNYSS